MEMSRIGRQLITIPEAVKIETVDSQVVVSGPKGSLRQQLLEGISYHLKDGSCQLQRDDDSRVNRARHGLMRSLVANMVAGVTEGFSKTLEIVGIGYKVRQEGQRLVFNLGFSHEVEYCLVEGIEASVEGNQITVSGIDKQKVGQTAASIRDLKRPEPYKGKGIRYKGEAVRRKAGKGAKEA